MIKLIPRVKLKEQKPLLRIAAFVRGIHWGKVLLFIFSLWLFILAITLMKEGARELAPVIRSTISIDNVASSLGFGWLFAYGVMSGSPVAAAALTFFDAEAISNLDAFAMITGSRLGASLIVLLIGFVYILRGHGRADSLGMGLLSLTVTGSTHLISFFVGILILASGTLDWVQFESGVLLTSLIDTIFYPIINLVAAYLPGWGLFVVGMLVILLSFNLFDRCLPTASLKQSQFGRPSRLVYRPVVMFLLGAFVTLLSMSVSVSLSLLVPLSSRGFVRRENVIPYIMGANITTFVDTLLAAILLGNPQAFTVVVAEMASIAIVCGVILAFFFGPYERVVLKFVDRLVHSNRNLAIFIGLIFLAPVLLVLL